MFARRIFIDIYISMFMALTLLFFALAERYPGRRRLFLVLMYTCVGLGILTKGPIAALLPGLVFAVYLIAHRELGRVREMLLPLGTLIVLVDRGALVCGALSAGGMGADQVVPLRREPRALRGRRRRECRSPGLVVPAGRLQRFVSVVAVPLSRRGVVVPRTCGRARWRRRLSHQDAAVDLDPGDRRLLLAVGGEAGPLHLPDRPGAGRARREW